MRKRRPYPRKITPWQERFWRHLEKTESCWNWTGWLDRDGYGQINSGSGRQIKAHRAAYMLLVGPIPEGLTIDHLCKNRRCVNPAHLEAVTARVNGMRGTGVGALNAAKTHCPKGHPLDALWGGARCCRTCRRLRYWQEKDEKLERKSA